MPDRRETANRVWGPATEPDPEPATETPIEPAEEPSTVDAEEG